MKTTESDLEDGPSAGLPINFFYPSLIHDSSSSLEVLAEQEMQAVQAPTQSSQYKHNKMKKKKKKNFFPNEKNREYSH